MILKFRRGGSITVDPKTKKITWTDTGEPFEPLEGEHEAFEFPPEKKAVSKGGELK